MHHPTQPINWRDIVISYDPRGLPFLCYYQEAGWLAAPPLEPATSSEPARGSR